MQSNGVNPSSSSDVNSRDVFIRGIDDEGIPLSQAICALGLRENFLTLCWVKREIMNCQKCLMMYREHPVILLNNDTVPGINVARLSNTSLFVMENCPTKLNYSDECLTNNISTTKDCVSKH